MVTCVLFRVRKCPKRQIVCCSYCRLLFKKRIIKQSIKWDQELRIILRTVTRSWDQELHMLHRAEQTVNTSLIVHAGTSSYKCFPLIFIFKCYDLGNQSHLFKKVFFLQTPYHMLYMNPNVWYPSMYLVVCELFPAFCNIKGGNNTVQSYLQWSNLYLLAQDLLAYKIVKEPWINLIYLMLVLLKHLK